MFPTLSSLINYLFGTSLDWSIPTFGFFVVLAFFLSFLVFRMEFKRKEKIGEIHPFYESRNVSIVQRVLILLGYALFGFLFGFKGWAFIEKPDLLIREPFNFLLSSYGHWGWGIAIGISFVIMAIFIMSREKRKSKGQDHLVHPYQLTPKMLLFCAVFGFIGSKFFNIMEDWDLHRNFSVLEILRFSGLTFYGGLIFGAIVYFIMGIRKKFPWRSLADIGALGMLVAYGVGRLGCHFSGDGDWGIVNNIPKPFSWLPDHLWAFNFPHNVIQQGIFIPGCVGKYCMVLPEAVFPTSAYESIFILTAFFILLIFRNKLRTPGLIASIYFVIIGVERLLIEYIRVNYKFNVFGVWMSEAQIISVISILLGIGLFIYIFKLKSSTSR